MFRMPHLGYHPRGLAFYPEQLPPQGVLEFGVGWLLSYYLRKNPEKMKIFFLIEGSSIGIMIVYSFRVPKQVVVSL